jgi:hypothetical protein
LENILKDIDMRNQKPIYLITCFHPEVFIGYIDEKELKTLPKIERFREQIEQTKRKLLPEGSELKFGTHHGPEPTIDTGFSINGNRYTKIKTTKFDKIIKEFDVRLVYTNETPGRWQQRWKAEFRNHFGDDANILPSEIKNKLIDGILKNSFISIRQLWINPINMIQYNPYPNNIFSDAANLMIGPWENRCKVLSTNEFSFKNNFWHINYDEIASS